MIGIYVHHVNNLNQLPNPKGMTYNHHMTQGESLISILLIIIIYLLYQIAKQLSYLTGKRLKISFFNWQINKIHFKQKPPKKSPPEKLPN